MKPKIALLALASLLFSAGAFAQEPAKGTIPTQAPATGLIIPAPEGLLKIEVAGKTIAVFSLNDQPKGVTMVLDSDASNAPVVYDSQKGLMTVKGKFSVEVKQGEKTLWRIAVEDGTGTYQFKMPATAVAPATAPANTMGFPFPLPTEQSGTFCGQSQVDRMVRNTSVWQDMQRQQEARRSVVKTEEPPAVATQPQPPGTPQK